MSAEDMLKRLVYGQGECKDLSATDSEFDRLAEELYPGWETQEAARRLLAVRYADIIRRGDIVLWEKAMDLQPNTVNEWKAAAQTAYAILEKKKAALGKGGGKVVVPRETFLFRLVLFSHRWTPSDRRC